MKEMKCSLCVLCLVFFLNLNIGLYAEIDIVANDSISLSDAPDLAELTDLFNKSLLGKLDPYDVLAKVIEKGDGAVKGLREFLYIVPEVKPDSEVVLDINRAKIYSILALDAIGTKNAAKVLFEAANHKDPVIRAEVIESFAYNTYNKLVYDDLTRSEKPDIEILHVLFENADDTTFIESSAMRIGEVARQGIKNWTGQDFGDISAIESGIKDASGNKINMKSYRKNWWAVNSKRYIWDKEVKRFILKD